MKVLLISLALSLSTSTVLLASDIHQSRAGISAASGHVISFSRGTLGHLYAGFGERTVQGYRGPLVVSPQWRQNQPGVGQLPADNVAPKTEGAASQSTDPNLALASQSLSSSQGTAPKAISLPSGVKPQVTTPAERSQATANINQKFQQVENKAANQPWGAPDRRNRLEQSRVFFIGLIDSGYPLSLLDLWCNDLLDDQVDVGMPVDLIDSYWGEPVSTQDYVEYYNPYEVCTYQTPDGIYLQVTFQNGLVAQPM